MSRRTDRIGKLLQETIGQMLFRELSDPRIDAARTSITRVKVQEDLLVAKVYVSVIGTEARQRLTVRALNHAAGRINALCRREVKLRHMPALEFHPDEQLKGAIKTCDIIREAMDEIHEKEARLGPAGEKSKPSNGQGA